MAENKKKEHPSPELDEAVRRHEERRRQWEEHGERPMALNLAMIGSLGWLIVLPTLLGILAGRWIDRLADSGIFWTGACLMIGLALGCVLAWKRMHSE